MGEYNMEGGIRRQVNRHACTDVRYLVVVCTYIHLPVYTTNLKFFFIFGYMYLFWLPGTRVPVPVQYTCTCVHVPFLCTKGAI
jgi:hypothetical protein